MKISKEIFREYDIRGTVGDNFTKKEVKQICFAYSDYLKKSKKKGPIILCRDNRKSSTEFYSTAKEAFISQGFDVLGLGMNPIGVFYFSLFDLNPAGGIMITASHLPPTYNGIKLASGKGILTLGGNQIQDLRKSIERKKIKSVKKKGTFMSFNIKKKYIDYISKSVKTEGKPKIAIDCGNAATSLIAKELFEKIGCKVTCLYCTPDDAFSNHLPDPSKKENMLDLIAKVKKGNYLCGLGFDGDGDRVGAVDEKGRMIEADKILALFSKDILEKEIKKGTVVFEVKCSKAVQDVITESGGKGIEFKAGHSNIKKKMKQTNAVLGGEMSGHIFFADKWPGFDDGLYGAARIVEYLTIQKRKFSSLVNSLPKYYSSPEYRLEVGEKEKTKIVNAFKKHFKKEKPLTIDGVKVYFKNGWLLVRASNTSPKISVRFEGNTKTALKSIQNKGKKAFKKIAPEVKLGF